MDQEIRTRLEQLAFLRATPFCYSCYEECPSGRCQRCGSDDLMSSLPGVGCEYGVAWIIEHILATELSPADMEEAFEQSVRDCYPETTKVAWAEFDTVQLLKEQDPVSWRCALLEYESQEESERNTISLDGGRTYYWRYDLESLVAELP